MSDQQKKEIRTVSVNALIFGGADGYMTEMEITGILREGDIKTLAPEHVAVVAVKGLIPYGASQIEGLMFFLIGLKGISHESYEERVDVIGTVQAENFSSSLRLEGEGLSSSPFPRIVDDSINSICLSTALTHKVNGVSYTWETGPREGLPTSGFIFAYPEGTPRSCGIKLGCNFFTYLAKAWLSQMELKKNQIA